MKFLVFYFSGTGNTKWVSEKFREILIAKGQEINLLSVENIDPQEIPKIELLLKDADIIGFANPIYGGNLPPIMMSLIHNIISIANRNRLYKPIFFINTFAYINGFGPICTKKLIKNSGLKLIGYLNIQICNNISSPVLKVKQISKSKLEQRKESAVFKLTEFAKKLIEGRNYIEGIGLYLIPNIFIRMKSKKSIRNNYQSLSVDINTCKKCMQCINHCPTHSISFNNNHFEFAPTCTACMRCYNNCPSFSIMIGGKFSDPDVYFRYYGPES